MKASSGPSLITGVTPDVRPGDIVARGEQRG